MTSEQYGRLPIATYLDMRLRDEGAFLAAAERGLEPEVPSCPGWSARDLLIHLGDVYQFWGTIVRERAQGEEGFRAVQDTLRDERLENDAWQPSAEPDRLFSWFRQQSDALQRALQTASPDEPIWTWWPPEQRVAFVQRRMAHETAVHRWDMEAAHGVAGPIDGDLARDGIDEVFDVMVPADRPDSKVPAHGESYHFHRTDGPGEWSVQFEGSEVAVRHEHVKADVAVRGTASDLLLFLWRRIPPDDVEILGDRDVLQRYFELVPPS